jgi:hypothetical protein
MEDTKYDITGLDKARVLAALVKGGAPVGLGILAAMATASRGGVTVAKCRAFLGEKPGYVDYAFGVPVKADFRGDSLDLWLFDRCAGQGTGKRVLDAEFGRDVAAEQERA